MTTNNLLLGQAVRRLDSPITGTFWAVSSGALLLFFAGATLGAVSMTQGIPTDTIIFTFVALMSLCLLCLAATMCSCWESVAERRARLVATLGSYLDAQADIASAKTERAH
tara:strand:- start:257 stop:589 length:333 start_codon:yes stop_codon:yes gene_type:complete